MVGRLRLALLAGETAEMVTSSAALACMVSLAHSVAVTENGGGEVQRDAHAQHERRQIAHFEP